MRLVFEAAAYPPFRAGFHANPPIEAFKHFEGARDTEMTGGIGVACMHDPRSCQKGHIYANGVIERWPSKTGREAISGLEATAAEPRTSSTASWSPWIKRPLAARSSMSAGSGR